MFLDLDFLLSLFLLSLVTFWVTLHWIYWVGILFFEQFLGPGCVSVFILKHLTRLFFFHLSVHRLLLVKIKRAVRKTLPPASPPTPSVAHNPSLKMVGFNRQGRPETPDGFTSHL